MTFFPCLCYCIMKIYLCLKDFAHPYYLSTVLSVSTTIYYVFPILHFQNPQTF